MNTFGKAFRVSTFGESHGVGIGCVIDGVPAGLKIDLDFIQNEIMRRKPGKNDFVSKRNESDQVQIVSGVYEGLTLGSPIAFFIKNHNQNSNEYDEIKHIFRPSHADFSYFHKYGLRDPRGGGRSSARESVARVVAGAIAKLILNEFNIKIKSGIYNIGGIECKKRDFKHALKSDIFALDENFEAKWKTLLSDTKKQKDSLGGSAFIKVFNAPIGLGEPLYYKLDGLLGEFLLGLNGVKAVEIGEGVNAAHFKGSDFNDELSKNGFLSNRNGGILGGISSGENIDIKVHFKPTPSIGIPQKSLNEFGDEVLCSINGRHDPCIAIRGSVVCEMMVAIAIVDLLLLNATSKMANLKKIYDFS